jgi:hypothetical protein
MLRISGFLMSFVPSEDQPYAMQTVSLRRLRPDLHVG